jgi:hypothetical protein
MDTGVTNIIDDKYATASAGWLQVRRLGIAKTLFHIALYTGCPRRKGQNFGRVFLMLKYTDITQNTYVQI